MNERLGQTIIHIGSPIFAAALASVPVLYLQAHPKLVLILLGALYGCAGIASIIRWVNLSADSRRGKEPLDDP
jgi:hypothetical protein